MSEQSPIWKKEIRLRSRAAKAPAPASGKRSLLTKEISLGRRRKGAVSVPTPPVTQPVLHSLPEPPAGVRELLAPRVDATLAAIDAAVVEAKEGLLAAHAVAAPAELLLVPEPSPAPVALAAAATAPAPVAEAKPFWKREVSIGQGSKPKPAAEPTPAKQPFWKKEIGGGSKSKPVAPPNPKPAADAKEKKEPFWKKEIGRGSKPKPTAAPKAAAEPKQPKTPFWKLEKRGGSKSKPDAAPKEKTGPFWKRELSLPGQAGADGDLAMVVGLRIGSSQLAAALVHNNGSAELLQLARTPLKAGLVAGGEVRDADALAGALKRFFAQHKLPRKGIRLGVATNRIGVRVLDMPHMNDPKLLANAIRFRAQEVLPIPIAEAVLDHIVLGESEDERGQMQHRVLLVFAHRELVDGYLNACRRAGLKLRGIDFDAFALLRALSDKGGQEPADKPAALVVVAIGHERTIFAVAEGPVCDFARVLEWGGGSLDAALARALDITPEQAERLKQTLSLSDDAATGDLSPVQLEAARAALRQEVQVLARELVSSLQFYQSRPSSLDIGELLLTGGGSELGGIDAELGRQLGVPVRVGDPLHRVTLGKGVVRPANAGSLAVAVGLGIEE
jgi:type IV pilus assembly protein PilM